MPVLDRIILVGSHRLANLPLAVSYDHMLQPGFRKTYIISPISKSTIWNLLEANGVDPGRFNYISDAEILDQCTDLNAWRISYQIAGLERFQTWHLQQGIKFYLISQSDADYVMIHDPDTLQIQPYRMIENDRINLLARSDDGPGSLFFGQSWIEAVIRRPCVSRTNWTTEMLLASVKDFGTLYQEVESSYQDNFFRAIWDLACQHIANFGPYRMPVIHETMLLGNWMALRRQIDPAQSDFDIVRTRRFEFTDIKQLEYLAELRHMPLSMPGQVPFDYVRVDMQPAPLDQYLTTINDQCATMSMTIDPKTFKVVHLDRYKHLIDSYTAAIGMQKDAHTI